MAGPDNQKKKLTAEQQWYYEQLAKKTRPIEDITRPQTAQELLSSEDEETEEGEPEVEIDEESLTDEGNDQEDQGYQQSPQPQGSIDQQIQQQQEKVPEYVEQPAAAKEAQPGGPAVTADKDKERARKEKEREFLRKKLIKGERQELAERALGLTWKDLTKKFTTEAIKKLAAQAWEWLAAATSEYWVPILLGIIGVIILIIGIVILIRAIQTPNANGSSPVQAADMVADHPLISTVLALSSAVDFQKTLDSNKTELLAKIDSFEAELNQRYPNEQATKTSIATLEEVKTLIGAYTTPDAAKAAEIHDKLLSAIKPWTIALNPGGMIFPAVGFSAGHVGAFTESMDYGPYNHRREHRGIDRALNFGTVYHAPTNGEIVYLHDSETDYPGVDLWHNGKGATQNSGFGNAIVVRVEGSDNNALNGYYWEIHHLKHGSATGLGLHVGSKVIQGQVIGACGQNGQTTGEHIHFQVDKPSAGGDSRGFPVGQGRLGQTEDPYKPLGWNPNFRT